MAKKAPGKHYRKGISISEFFKMFPDDKAAEDWFTERRWANGVACPQCGSLNVLTGTSKKNLPYRCREKGCVKQFSVKYGTFMQSSKIGYRDWLFTIFLISTNLKSISSMKLHRDLGVTQKTAWHMAHRVRNALKSKGGLFLGPVEVDETYMGGKRKNMSKSKRAKMDGRGTTGKTAIVGMKDRQTNWVSARVVEDTKGETLRGFVSKQVLDDTTIYTDEAMAYQDLPNQEAVKHSVLEYVRGPIHTNGIESFWSLLKRAHMGTFHCMSPKHLNRYVDEFVSRHNMRELGTLQQMDLIAARIRDTRLRYKDLVG